MSYIIKGILNRQLPWGLVLLGVMIAVVLEMSGIPSLAFAVGVYLPLSSTMPVFLGGLVRKLADRVYRRPPDAEDEPEGTLYSSGVIAGASILAIAAAFLAFDSERFDGDKGYHTGVALLRIVPDWLDETLGAVRGPISCLPSDILTFGVILVLGFLLLRGARPRAD